jgi:hypothetical protein
MEFGPQRKLCCIAAGIERDGRVGGGHSARKAERRDREGLGEQWIEGCEGEHAAPNRQRHGPFAKKQKLGLVFLHLLMVSDFRPFFNA